MRVKLHVLRYDEASDYSGGKRFRFVVVDLDKPKKYPLNFVCMMPLRFGGGKNSKFSELFGGKSLKVAKRLLVDALKVEGDADVRGEIERRLRLLDPESAYEKLCVSCGKAFQVDREKRFKRKFCEDCLRRKFGSRE